MKTPKKMIPEESVTQSEQAPVQFKIDTGADISVLPESMFEVLKEVTIKLSTKRMHSPSSNTLTLKESSLDSNPCLQL